MATIPFKVSARTAMLLGRENVATAKGAIIELVKNSYDADSKVSIIYFDNQYTDIKLELSAEHVEYLLKNGVAQKVIDDLYRRDIDGLFILKNDAEPKSRGAFLNSCKALNTLYIIDSGEGMNHTVIDDYWMTIGTNNKLLNAFSSNSRVKAGAKGIGRFALDRLGSACEMLTFFDPSKHKLRDSENSISGYRWNVDWYDFEAESKTLTEIVATLDEIPDSNLSKELFNIDKEFSWDKYLSDGQNHYGTILKITNLRDLWDDDAIAELYSDLEVLVPPKETDDFKIALFSSCSRDKYGEVLSSICDDYDYKLTAKADNYHNVKITIYRQEYDVESIPLAFFDRPAMKKYPRYSRESFKNGSWSIDLNFSNLIPGFKEADVNEYFNEIGPFEFSFYFLKRAASSPDSKRFFYRSIASNVRKDWLSKFGGIKLFRDNFRVRPYGEAKDVAFDWLGLGNRKTNSPAGIAKTEGGYRVEPENVAGAIKISRLANLNFEDKSSREGLQENEVFQLFKTLISEIIHIFEADRAYIAREMDAFYKERFREQNEIDAIEKLALKIVDDNRVGASSSEPVPKKTPEDEQIVAFAHVIESKNEIIEKLEEEQILLRALASSGIVSASFGHDFSKMSETLHSRVDDVISLFSTKITPLDYALVERRKNPFSGLEKMKAQDLKLRNWLNFSLGFTRKDKRKRKFLELKQYFEAFAADWELAFKERAIEFKLDCEPDMELRVFEIDFDSIFSNLVVNSIHEFRQSKAPPPRIISISCSRIGNHISIEYKDTGPGISKDLVDPDVIFRPLFTTRRNSKGEEIGTGLGMWIIKSVVEDNSGKVNLIFPDNGFGIRFSFPMKGEYKNDI